MRKTDFDKAIAKVIALKMRAIDMLVTELIKPLEITDNPEDLIKKPFEQWTPQDLELLKKIYGVSEDTILTKFIFKKTYERVQALEKEEL